MIYYSYQGNFQVECDAEIVACQFIDETKEVEPPEFPLVQIFLNRTVLHAQGGGQPTDTGVIQIGTGEEETKIMVEKVILDRGTGVASHTGKLVAPGSTQSSSLIGQHVKVVVDADGRKILSECHTAGHVVDMAMAKCDTILPATKAYHFLDSPYVEYKGNVPAEDRGPLLEKLQKAFQELVEADIETEIFNVSLQEAEDICNRVAENYFNLKEQFQEGETVRIVRVAGWPCPCGGTHVKSSGLLKERNWGVTGLKCKKGAVRVKYGMLPQCTDRHNW
jgi:Ser-tRNA(Ala) deacylase AlaX